MASEQEVSQLLSLYRTTHIREVSGDPTTSIRIKAEIPPSVTCPELDHVSPTDFTLTLMQMGYVTVGLSIPNLPPDFQHNALFLTHDSHYNQQRVETLEVDCRLKQLRRGVIDVAVLEMKSPGILEAQLICGIPRQEPQAVTESQSVQGEKLSQDQLAEILSIYNGEVQSDVVEVGYNPTNSSYETVVHFQPYSEAPTSTHVSAKQMIEALMKVAYCVGGHQAYLGNLPISYSEFLGRRLDFLTSDHSLKYRKLLTGGSQSLIRCQLFVQENGGTLVFTNRPQATKEQESFATGRMSFRLPT